ncbi:MAG: guanylate kinase [Lachnospiraceae bacterium]|nr:guanylate kinase [Lachnospiraceae bacterium]MDD6191582.1 guanylate kinase [Lachnospiraceae bacterium]
MGKIFCIMGKSSTGKDTLYQRLLDREDLKLQQIVSYTTRPIRAGEIDGIEYHFCTQKEKGALLAEGKVVEIRSYHTCHGVWDYFTVDDGQIDLEHHDYLIIGTIESYLAIRDYFSGDVVVPIYIEVEDGIRLQRALQREMAQENPKYEEMCRRFLADAKDFSPEKIKEAAIGHIFYNECIDKTEEIVASYIKSLI